MLNLCLKTERLFLISFSEGFLNEKINQKKSNYYYWMGDEEVNRYNSHGLFPQTENELKSFFDRCKNDKNFLCFALEERSTGIHVGMISLQRIDFVNRSAEFAILIGEKDFWGNGFATEAIKKIFEHGFLRLGLHRIWSGTSELNLGMVKVFQKLGMHREGIFFEGQFLNGKFYNVLSFAILENEFKDKLRS